MCIIKKIISCYTSENPGTKANLVRILTQGALANTGKMVILPVDQGFEHGPGSSFACNAPAYDPNYHVQLALDAKLSAYAAPLGMLSAVADTYAGLIPLILKLNSSYSLNTQRQYDQAVTATVRDAIYLGCTAIGFTLYPGSNQYYAMVEELREIIKEAKSYGLVVVVWAYPRGNEISKENETALDVITYSAHMACLLGAHIVKVKLPTARIMQKNYYTGIDTLENRIAIIKQACFNGKRLVVFSGGSNKERDLIYQEVAAINKGGGNGSIIGRNTFQRPYDEAIAMLKHITDIYKD